MQGLKAAGAARWMSFILGVTILVLGASFLVASTFLLAAMDVNGGNLLGSLGLVMMPLGLVISVACIVNSGTAREVPAPDPGPVKR